MGDKVAEVRTVVRNPLSGDPNAGVLVAAGDPLPEGALPLPYIENTPNKVDAATNRDVADAADQARSPTPAGPTPVAPAHRNADAERELAEAQARTAENRDKFADDMRRLSESAPVEPGKVPDAEAQEGPQDVAYLTVAQLDELAAGRSVADYPAKGNKAEKVAAVKAAGITEA